MNKKQILDVIQANENAMDAAMLALKTSNQSLRLLVENPPITKTYPEWMDYETAAEYLSMPKGTLYHLKAKGIVPWCKVGSAIRFKKSDLDAHIEKTRFESDEQIKAKLSRLKQ